MAQIVRHYLSRSCKVLSRDGHVEIRCALQRKICVERLELWDWVSYSDDDCLVARIRVAGYVIAGDSEELADSSILPWT